MAGAPINPRTTTYQTQLTDNEGGGQTTVYTPNLPAAPAAPASVTPAPVPIAPPPAPVNSMPATALGTNPAPYSTYFPPATASANLTESAIASKDAYLANTANEADQLKAEQETGKQSITDIFAKLSGQATKKADLYDSSGVNQDQRDIDELNNNIDSTSRSFDKQIQAVQNSNPNGALDPGVQIEVNRLNQQKASTLADMAIVLNAKTRNFTTAKNIIDTRVDAETEDLKNNLTGLQFFYSENASNLSKDQQDLLQDKITDAQNEYQDAKDTRSKIGDIQLDAAKNGAPVSVIKAIAAAQTPEDAIAASGGFLKTPAAAGAGTFTPSQENNGAANAGVSIADFKNFDADTKNYFINGYSQFETMLKQHDDGTLSDDQVAQNIASATGISDAAKQILYTKAGVSAPSDTSTDSGSGFFSNALQFVGNLFSS